MKHLLANCTISVIIIIDSVVRVHSWGSLKIPHPLALLSYPSRKSSNQPELTAVYYIYLAQSLSCTFKRLNHLFTEVITPEPFRELGYCLARKTHLHLGGRSNKLGSSCYRATGARALHAARAHESVVCIC